MTVHLVSLPVPRVGLARWARDRAFGPRQTQDDGVVLHALLGGLFGKSVLQPYRLFQPQAGDGMLYGYCAHDAAQLRETAEMAATPDMSIAVDLRRLRSKPMPVPRVQQRIGFDVRVRPVRRLTEGAGVRERDAFVAEAFRDHPDDLRGMIAQSRDREAVYRDWLVERMAGATVETARLARFQRSRVLRNGRAIEGPDAVFHGTLGITDPDAFMSMLAGGVGRHRAWGFGMLMLRPPDTTAPEQ